MPDVLPTLRPLSAERSAALAAAWSKAGPPKRRRGPGAPAAPPWFGLQQPPTYYSRGWTDSRIEQVHHFKEVVYKAVHAVASAVAGQAPNVSRSKSGTIAEVLSERGYVSTRAVTPIQTHEDLEPVDPGHPLCTLLADANGWDTGWDLHYETVIYLLLTGSAYWWLAEPNGLGVPTQLWVIPSHWVWPVPGVGTLIDYYEIRPLPGGGKAFQIPASEVVHFKRPSPISKLDGYSPLTAGALACDVYESIQRSKFHTFKNGALPQVAVEFDPDYQDPDDATLENIERKFMQRYSGETKAGRPLLMPPGVRVKPWAHSPRELDFLNSTQCSEDDILSLFGVPPVVLGKAKQMTYGSVTAAMAAFCSFTVNPLLQFLGVSATQKLAWKFDRALRVWYAQKTPDDPEHREKEIENDLRNGVRGINEVRRVRGLTPYPHGGDNPLIAAIGLELPYATGGEAKFLGQNTLPKSDGGPGGDSRTSE